ncbi:thiamine diphosphokinase [Porphyromonadaceae bacterium W3.11]|nr:thiamine diphosphokinase [Porphyromonadaceae bacterium W3.11]
MSLDLSDTYLPQVAIIANGDLRLNSTISMLLDNVPHIIVCDGATSSFLALCSRRPDVIIGDGDSVDDRDLERIGMKFTWIPDQETNDLTKAVTYALQKGWNQICILGASGRREDHTLGNIALLAEYYDMGAEVRMITDYGVMFPFKGLLRIEVAIQQQLSFFALRPSPMSARGVAYPFENRTFNALWEATLNYAVEEVVEVESEEVALIYIANEVRG